MRIFIQEFNIIKGHLNFAPRRTSLLSLDIQCNCKVVMLALPLG